MLTDADCPNEDAFVALFEHTLSAEEASRLEAHVDACVRCQRLIGALGRMQTDSPGSGGEEETSPRRLGAITRGTSVGRYVVLSSLGVGSMGVVFAAYDPELDRKVALKLLRPDVEPSGGAETQARLLREAQTIARVVSPHVIGVYDVGAFEGRVFLAMEFAEGSTLTDWLDQEKRAWEDVLRVFVAAGHGLASAHAVGVVHRDFKPDNVLITRSGQVKVADFGLARPESLGSAAPRDLPEGLDAVSAASALTGTQTGARVGTPAYMSPEQHRGQRADARSDQFSFSVAFYEGLVGERPPRNDKGETVDARLLEETLRRRVPGWLSAAIARGLRNDPSTRHSSMVEFLRVLETTPRQRTRRAVALVALFASLVVAATATVVVRTRPRGQALVCSGAEEKVAAVWSGERKRAIEVAFDKTGLPYAEFAAHRVGEIVDAYTREWAAMRQEACAATRVRGDQSEAMLDLRMACLDRRLEQVKTLAEVFERGSPETVQKATAAANGLSPLSDCTSNRLAATGAAGNLEAARKAHPEMAAMIDRAGILGRGGEIGESDRLAGEARDAARAAALPSLEAAALAGLARNKAGVRDWPGAKKLYFDAFEAAERSGAAAISAEAAIKLGFIDAMLDKVDDSQQWLRLASAVLERLGGDQRLEIALAQAQASALFMAGKLDRAIEASRKAVSLAEAASEKFPMLLSDSLTAYGNALSVTEDSAAKDAAYERALAISESELGPQHPMTGVSLGNLALARLDEERYEEALTFGLRALAISEKLGAGYAMQAEDCTAVGSALIGLERYPEARSYLERARGLAEKNPSFEKRELAELYVTFGQLDDRTSRDADAERDYERAVALFVEALGKGHPDSTHAYLGLGLLHLKQGRAADARAVLEASLAASDHGDVAAWQTRLALARALWETGGDRARARALALEAVDHYAKHPAGEKASRDLEEWLRVHGALSRNGL